MRRRNGWLRCRLPRLVALVPCGAWTNPMTSANGLPETSKVALGTFGRCSAQASQVARQQHKETLTWLPHVESLHLGTQVRWSHRVDYIACLRSWKWTSFIYVVALIPVEVQLCASSSFSFCSVVQSFIASFLLHDVTVDWQENCFRNGLSDKDSVPVSFVFYAYIPDSNEKVWLYQYTWEIIIYIYGLAVVVCLWKVYILYLMCGRNGAFCVWLFLCLSWLFA